MRQCKLMEITGKSLRDAYRWLEEKGGCASWWYASTGKHRIVVAMGWHDTGDGSGVIAWKIGQQTHNNIMQQCDFDFDFEMPWNTEAYCKKMNAKVGTGGRRPVLYDEGGVYDTLETIELCEPRRRRPSGYKGWDALAAHVRMTARRVKKYVETVDACEEEEGYEIA